ncbi:methyltransferase domain-containing protein [soil metagenome]
MDMPDPAETYESFMVPTMFEPMANHLLEFAAPRDGERVLDLACGTGVVARKLAARSGPGHHIVGLDFDSRMLAVARAAALRDGLTIDWHEGDAAALPFPNRSFNVVLCQMAMQFLPDRHKAMIEANRVLVPGGRIALNAWYGLDRNPFQHALNEATSRHLGVGMLVEPFCLDDPDEVAGILRTAGFIDVVVAPVQIVIKHPDPDLYLTRQILGSSAVLAPTKALDASKLSELAEAIREDMGSALQAHTFNGHLEIPLSGYMISAKRPTS